MGTGPMVITESGHGYQPYWPVYHDAKGKTPAPS